LKKYIKSAHIKGVISTS